MIYQDRKTQEISFPLGGIGTGSIGLCGIGGFIDWEIFNRPAKGSANGYTNFAVSAKIGEKTTAKVLRGDQTNALHGNLRITNMMGYGCGASSVGLAGMPHFKNCTFDGRFPMAKLTFTDDDFPGKVELTAFNPLIPHDSKNSSLPVAIFQLTFVNDTSETVEYGGVLGAANPFKSTLNENVSKGRIKAVKLLHAGVEKTDKTYGDLTVACDDENAFAQTYWYRGGWQQDDLVMFWREFTQNAFNLDRHYDEPSSKDACTVGSFVRVKAGGKYSLRFVLSWNVPNNYNYWSPYQDENGADITWRNYYATLFESSAQSAHYVLENYRYLSEKTQAFVDELYASTLDEAVIDAISATVSVLKSPTVLRLENGDFYGWEGTLVNEGSCEGTCQHVWNYAYALCFLFPDLEQSIRRQEFQYSMDGDGHMQFRLKLPVERNQGHWHACVDGQMGAVIKSYREWKLSGDDEFLKAHWGKIKLALEYAWSDKNPHRWDFDKDGVLEGRQHHTLDMELYGPSGWLQGFYLVALKAAAEMANYLGEENKADEYLALFEKGKQWTKDNLFNGEYYQQKINLKDKSILDGYEGVDNYWNAETQEIKYQIGEGCEIDQLCGQWHANLLGLGDIFDREQRKIALKNLFKNNFKSSMRNFVNPWRIFALNDEAGAIICDYPKGKYKPSIPIAYCEESMHGFGYALAGLLIGEGMEEEGLTIVRSIRALYDGEKRNPWNEMECGSNYARSMASFALLPIYSGFLFDAPHKTIGFAPVKAPFRSPFFTANAWGRVEMNEENMKISLLQGELELSAIRLPKEKNVSTLTIDGKAVQFTAQDGKIAFTLTTIAKEIQIQF